MDKLIFTKDWTNPADFTTYESNEANVRADIQLLHDEAKDAINAVIDALESPSGAASIAATAVTDLDGATVQALLESLRNKLKSSTDGTSGADFVSATAVSGLSGASVQALIESLKDYIDAHKNSTDHDDRYYTEFEVNTLLSNHHAATSTDHDDRYYSKANMQTSGQSQLHWGNLTNVPNMADSSWKTAVANKAALPLSGNTVNDQRVVLDDGDGKQAMYVCIATTGTVDQQWDKIGDVDWTNDHGNLVGLGDDDHTQYHNDTRGDARYYTKTQVESLIDSKAGAVIREMEVVATAGQTVFNLSSVGSYDIGTNAMNVYKKGITGRYEELDKDDYIETSSTVVTTVYPAMVGDEYMFRWYENTPELISTYAKKDGTLQTNLNADLLDGKHSSDVAQEGAGLVFDSLGVNIALYTIKDTPADVDAVVIFDSEAPAVTKQLRWTAIKSAIATYYNNLTTTLTNKRITKRVYSASSVASHSFGVDSYDMSTLLAQAAALTIAAPGGGTPTNGQPIMIRIKDNGTARALTWDAIFRAIGVTLPTTTVAGKTLYIGAVYNSADVKWDVLSVGQEA